MGKIRALGLLAFVVALWSCGSNAFAQQVAGGMGEPVHIGAFGPEGRMTARNTVARPPAKARRASNAAAPEARARYATPTLPGRHLR